MQAGPPLPPVLVMGAGAWGTAFAVHLATLSSNRGGGPITLWVRDPKQANEIERARTNQQYLPGILFPAALSVQADGARALQDWRKASERGVSGPGVLVFAGPLASLEDMAERVLHTLGPAARSGEGLIWLAKGVLIHQPSGSVRFASDLLGHLPAWPKAALSGPSFAQEVAKGLPSALALASTDLDWAQSCAQRLHGGPMRLYPTDDLVGVQLGGAMKNVLAIAAGISDGLELGGNARAALLTRGLAEAARLGQAMGARAETFLGLGALGDLVLTATGDLSRNRRVGLALAQGQTLGAVLRDLGHVAEGVGAAPALAQLALDFGVDCPIVQAVNDLLAGRAQVQAVCERLMARAMSQERL
ncbi:MAG: NAD(P)H-dependent glycerol-3-phosphate dehydrogenase [Burkholderiaceae bacterium]